MPDQFTQEYIAYILSDEAKGLQDGYLWDIGDYFMVPQYQGDLVFLLGYEEQRCRFEEAGTDKVAVWLLTLHDLLQIIEGAGWAIIEISLCIDGDGIWPKAHIWASAECVAWHPEGTGFWRCEECGDDLHEQDDGSVTCGPFPKGIEDEDYDAWDDGSKLPTCPHCGWAAEEDLMLAAAKLAVRAVDIQARNP